MTMPAEAILFAIAVLTLAVARALVPRAYDASDGKLDSPQHRDAEPPANRLGAEGGRFDPRVPYRKFRMLLLIIASLLALWFVLSVIITF
jgi:hypothetical protein